MAIEFNGKGNVNNFKIGKEFQGAKDHVKEEKIAETHVDIDNKFVKEMGEDLLTANAANVFGVKLNKVNGTKIDKDFWGDALNGLKLKDTAVSEETTGKINELDQIFAVVDMEQKMANSPFIKALNKEFNI